MRIGLFVTCLTDTLFPETGQAVVAVLERLGHQVDFPILPAPGDVSPELSFAADAPGR